MKKVPSWVWPVGAVVVVFLVLVVVASRCSRQRPALATVVPLASQTASAPAAISQATAAQPPVVGVVKVDFSDITNYRMNVDEAVSKVPPPPTAVQKPAKPPMSAEMRRRYEIWVERK